ncbi:MAG: hypothetical protein JO086_11730 [Acidimicrobiia bacterium]|nr:hypothetical protein [Acidimicrobiia bacterium]
MRRAQTSLRIATLAALAAIVLAACGGGGKSSTAAKSAAAVSSTTTPDPQTAQQAAVLQGWRDYWNTYLDLGTRGAPLDPRLKDVATGTALNNSIAALQARYLAGQVYKGTYDLRPTILTLNGTNASVRDCLGDHTDVYNTRTSTVDVHADARRTLRTGTLTFIDGGWKVATIENGGPCTE